MTIELCIAADLVSACGAQGIVLVANGDGGLTIDTRADVLTPELLHRLTTYKPAILQILDYGHGVTLDGCSAGESEIGPIEFIDLDELTACTECGLLEMWQTGAGTWRCERCDPPTVAIRILETVGRLRRRSVTDSTSLPVGQPDDSWRCQCGSKTWRDVAIHEGESLRRDCERCGKFVEFPRWYGRELYKMKSSGVGCVHGEEANKTCK